MNRSLIVIGNFDGVHRGHQALLAAVAREGQLRSLCPRLLTFEPHPAVVLGREPPARLTTLARKKELVARACPGALLVEYPFSRELAALSPEHFVERILVAELDARVVVVGQNFRFGRRRSGGIAELQRLGRVHGFAATVEPLVGDETGAWSSTRVRELVAAGDVVLAARILGRPHMLSGVVVRGDRRGRALGFPTCNLADVPEALPPFGVYAVLVDRVVEGETYALARGVANLGLRPTVVAGAARPLLEVHLFDVDEELYGTTLRVHLIARLREERRFAGLEALRAQIATDSSAARRLLGERHPDPPIAGAWA